MKRFVFTTVTALLFGLTARVAAGADNPVRDQGGAPVVSVYWAGTKSLAATPATAGLQRLFSIDASLALKQATLDKLGRRIAGEMGFAATNEFRTAVELLRPPLNLIPSTAFVLTRNAETPREWTLAVPRQSAAALQLESALKVLAQRIGRRVAGHGTDWAFLCAGDRHVCRVSRTNGWQVFQIGPRDAAMPDPKRLRQQLTRGATNPVLLGFEYHSATRVTLQVTTRKGDVRSEGHVRVDGMKELKLEPFRVPTNSLRDPLISFTAVRGIRDWLASLPALKPWKFSALPGQAFVWARGDIPFQTLVTAPVPDAPEAIDRATPRALQVLSPELAAAGYGLLQSASDRHELIWRGFPILVPFLRPGAEPGEGWVLGGTMAGIIPTGENTNPPPKELFAVVNNRPDLVYYDWEITQQRLQHLRGTVQLILMATPMDQLLRGGPGQQWLTAIEGMLGNTATEVTQISPGEFRMVRNSHLGFSALELIALGYWLDNPDFPSLKYPKSQRPGVPAFPALPGAKP